MQHVAISLEGDKMKVIVKKQIHASFSSSSSKDKYMVKVVGLPFTPFIGLELGDGKDWGAIIKEVYYDVSKEEFHVYTDSDNEFYQRGLKSNMLQSASEGEMNSKVQEYIEMGWELESD